MEGVFCTCQNLKHWECCCQMIKVQGRWMQITLRNWWWQKQTKNCFLLFLLNHLLRWKSTGWFRLWLSSRPYNIQLRDVNHNEFFNFVDFDLNFFFNFGAIFCIAIFYFLFLKRNWIIVGTNYGILIFPPDFNFQK